MDDWSSSEFYPYLVRALSFRMPLKQQRAPASSSACTDLLVLSVQLLWENHLKYFSPQLWE